MWLPGHVQFCSTFVVNCSFTIMFYHNYSCEEKRLLSNKNCTPSSSTYCQQRTAAQEGFAIAHLVWGWELPVFTVYAMPPLFQNKNSILSLCELQATRCFSCARPPCECRSLLRPWSVQACDCPGHIRSWTLLELIFSVEYDYLAIHLVWSMDISNPKLQTDELHPFDFREPCLRHCLRNFESRLTFALYFPLCKFHNYTAMERAKRPGDADEVGTVLSYLYKHMSLSACLNHHCGSLLLHHHLIVMIWVSFKNSRV